MGNLEVYGINSDGSIVQGSIIGNTYSISLPGGQSLTTVRVIFKNKVTGNLIKGTSSSGKMNNQGQFTFKKPDANVNLTYDIQLIYSPVPSNKNTYILIP